MENSKDQKTTEGFKMRGDWDLQSKELKSKYPQLTDEDLKFTSEQENDLLRRMGKRLNKNREEVVNIIQKVQPEKAL